MDQAQLEALLGRSLTSNEVSNLTLYIDIATQNLEGLLCTYLDDVTETRVFDTREGYKTAFVDIFWNITEVKLDDEVTTDYQVRQWDRRNGDWYNSLVFDQAITAEEVTVTASWGFSPVSDGSPLPYDLQLVLAGLFDLITKKNKADGTISSKRVEDFQISFNNADLDDEFYKKYNKTISKYSICDIANLQSGSHVC